MADYVIAGSPCSTWSSASSPGTTWHDFLGFSVSGWRLRQRQVGVLALPARDGVGVAPGVHRPEAGLPALMDHRRTGGARLPADPLRLDRHLQRDFSIWALLGMLTATAILVFAVLALLPELRDRPALPGGPANAAQWADQPARRPGAADPGTASRSPPARDAAAVRAASRTTGTPGRRPRYGPPAGRPPARRRPPDGGSRRLAERGGADHIRAADRAPRHRRPAATPRGRRSLCVGRAGRGPAGRPRRVRRPSGARACESGGVVSLLARLPRRAERRSRPLPLGLARGALRSPSPSPDWPGWGWRSSSSRPSTPPAGWRGGSFALAGRLWLLAQGGELDVGSGPLVLAPLLLTLGDRLGTVPAGAGSPASRDRRPPGRARAGRARRRARPAHRVLALAAGRPRRRGRAAPDAGGRRRPGVVAVGWGVGRESGLLDRRSTGCPVPRARAARSARGPADRAGAVHGRRRGRPGLRRPRLRDAVRLPRRRGRRGAGAARRWGCCCCRTRRPRSSGSPPAPGSSSAPARSSRCTG